MGIPESLAQHPWMDKRAEQLSVSEFEEMTAMYEAEGKLRK
jgi:hypothetical protein